jgi:hypothetical protein
VSKYTKHLNEEDAKKVTEILTKYNIVDGFDAWVCVWGRKSFGIQVDGDLSLNDLRCLTEIAEYLNKEG